MINEISKVIDLNTKKKERVLDFSDFHKQDIKFNIDKLQEAYNQIVKIKKFEDAGYVVENVVAIIDRQEVCSKCNTGEADSAMKDANLKLTSLFKLEEII